MRVAKSLEMEKAQQETKWHSILSLLFLFSRSYKAYDDAMKELANVLNSVRFLDQSELASPKMAVIFFLLDT